MSSWRAVHSAVVENCCTDPAAGRPAVWLAQPAQPAQLASEACGGSARLEKMEIWAVEFFLVDFSEILIPVGFFLVDFCSFYPRLSEVLTPAEFFLWTFPGSIQDF